MDSPINSSTNFAGDHALFLTSAHSASGDITDKIFSPLAKASSASNRFQLLPAFKAAIRLGLSPRVLSLKSSFPEDLELIANARVCLVGKLITSHNEQASSAMANLSAIARLRRKKIPILSTYSDNWCQAVSWANNPKLLLPQQDLYRDIMKMTDIAIFPSKTMLQLGKYWLNVNSKSKLIPDPCYLNRCEFLSDNIKEVCKLIWFGHGSNADFLLRELSLIISRCSASRLFQLTVLTDQSTCNRINYFFKQYNVRGNWKLRTIDWFDTVKNSKLFADELSHAHIALLPSDPNSLRKSTASHNRAVDACQSGCMVIASPIKSYQELSDLIIITTDFAQAIDKGINQYRAETEKMSLLRDRILLQFSSDNIIHLWEKVFVEALELSFIR